VKFYPACSNDRTGCVARFSIFIVIPASVAMTIQAPDLDDKVSFGGKP
jgi:hypothetical protein